MDLFRLQKFTTTYFFQTNGRVRSRYVFTYRKQWKWAGHCLVRGPYFHCFIIKCGSEFQKVACAVKDSIKQLISKLTQSQIFLDERNCFLNFFRFCTRGQFLFLLSFKWSAPMNAWILKSLEKGSSKKLKKSSK